VREDAHLLYGFGTEGERRAFRQLLKISGVGARTSLAVLSGLSVAELAEAVTLQESGRLTRIPGIGKKTAERLLLELKDKVELTTSIAANRPAPATSDMLRALLALGYSEKEAAAAVRQLPEGLSVSDGIRQALKSLSRA
jgi:Holliday junction DNA helicase RuvA